MYTVLSFKNTCLGYFASKLVPLEVTSMKYFV